MNFRCAQQEDLAGQTVCSLLRRTTRTAVLAIRELDLLDCALNVAIKQFQERVVQVRVDVAAFVLVDISALPNAVLVDVLHQQPSAVARLVVHAGRLTLMHDDELSRLAVDRQLDGTANGLGAQKHICHFVFLLDKS